MNDYFTFFYVKHFELPMCMKCAIQINLPCLAYTAVLPALRRRGEKGSGTRQSHFLTRQFLFFFLTGKAVRKQKHTRTHIRIFIHIYIYIYIYITIDRCVCAFPNHVQSTEFATGLEYRNILKTIQ